MNNRSETLVEIDTIDLSSDVTTDSNKLQDFSDLTQITILIQHSVEHWIYEQNLNTLELFFLDDKVYDEDLTRRNIRASLKGITRKIYILSNIFPSHVIGQHNILQSIDTVENIIKGVFKRYWNRKFYDNLNEYDSDNNAERYSMKEFSEFSKSLSLLIILRENNIIDDVIIRSILDCYFEEIYLYWHEMAKIASYYSKIFYGLEIIKDIIWIELIEKYLEKMDIDSNKHKIINRVMGILWIKNGKNNEGFAIFLRQMKVQLEVASTLDVKLNEWKNN